MIFKIALYNYCKNAGWIQVQRNFCQTKASPKQSGGRMHGFISSISYLNRKILIKDNWCSNTACCDCFGVELPHCVDY